MKPFQNKDIILLIFIFKNKKHRRHPLELKYCNYTMYNFLKKYHTDFGCIVLFPKYKAYLKIC